MSRKRKRGNKKDEEIPSKKRRKIQNSQSSTPESPQSPQIPASQSSQQSTPSSSQKQQPKKGGRKPRAKKKAPRKKKRVEIKPEIFVKMVNQLIRYVMSLTSGSKVVKKDDVRKYVLRKFSSSKGHAGLIDRLVIEANKKLRLTFGYELVDMTTKMIREDGEEANMLDTQQLGGSQATDNVPEIKRGPVGQKVWVLRMSRIPSPSFTLTDEQLKERCSELMSEERAKKLGLLTLITGFIYGKRDNLPENVLWEQLGRVGIHKGLKHPDFGKPERVINEFLRVYYLIREKDEVESKHEGKPVYKYRFGPRIHKDVNLSNIMGFLHESIDAELSSDELKKVEEYNKKFDEEVMAMSQVAFQDYYVTTQPDEVAIVPPPPISSQNVGQVVRRRTGTVVVDEDEDDDEVEFVPPGPRRGSSQSTPRRRSSGTQEITSQTLINIDDDD